MNRISNFQSVKGSSPVASAQTKTLSTTPVFPLQGKPGGKLSANTTVY